MYEQTLTENAMRGMIEAAHIGPHYIQIVVIEEHLIVYTRAHLHTQILYTWFVELHIIGLFVH